MGADTTTRWARKLAGATLTATSIALLYLLASPWQQLGGIVDERLRWLESYVLFAGAIVGFTLAQAVGVGTPYRPRRPSGVFKALFYPAAGAAALMLLVLRFAGPRDAIGIVTTALVSYVSGLAFALAGLPLLAGRAPGAADADGASVNSRS